MQKYSTYKPSNVEWLGDVPSHWKVSEIKHDLEFTTGFTPPTSNAELFDGDITWVTIADMDQKYISNSKTKLTAEAIANAKAQIVPKGSLLYSFKLSIGKVAFAETDLYTNEAIACFLPNVKFNPNFLYYAFETYLHNYGKENIYGALLLNREIIKAAKITYPKFTEQTSIAAYLDQATANIDQVIVTKQKQLEKLEQYKQSKIHECVTKGLNPDVTLKPSGIDWIGEVPEHWKSKRFKDVFEMLDFRRIPLSSEERNRMEKRIYDYYGASGIIDKVEDYIFDEQTILIAEDGANLLSRSSRLVFIASGKYWVNNHAHVFKPRFGSLIYFAELLELNDFSPYVTGAAQPKLNYENLSRIKIVVPPTKEQFEIEEFLQEVISKIEKEKSIIEQQIEKLKQYRKCLIHECVTGKRKVTE